MMIDIVTIYSEGKVIYNGRSRNDDFDHFTYPKQLSVDRTLSASVSYHH